jgi:hypothetical protein
MAKILMNFFRQIILQASWCHEIFHIIPAKLLGIQFTAYPDHIIHELADEEWKNFLVVMGPFMVGAVLFSFLWYLTGKGLDRGWLWPAGFYWASSVRDFTSFCRFVATGDW